MIVPGDNPIRHAHDDLLGRATSVKNFADHARVREQAELDLESKFELV